MRLKEFFSIKKDALAIAKRVYGLVLAVLPCCRACRACRAAVLPCCRAAVLPCYGRGGLCWAPLQSAGGGHRRKPAVLPYCGRDGLCLAVPFVCGEEGCRHCQLSAVSCQRDDNKPQAANLQSVARDGRRRGGGVRCAVCGVRCAVCGGWVLAHRC